MKLLWLRIRWRTRALLGIRDVHQANLRARIRAASAPTAEPGVPNRAELVGKIVVLELHPWAVRGPRRGVLLGQGERGLSIRMEGGGRFVYRHHEVKSVKPAAP